MSVYRICASVIAVLALGLVWAPTSQARDGAVTIHSIGDPGPRSVEDEVAVALEKLTLDLDGILGEATFADGELVSDTPGSRRDRSRALGLTEVDNSRTGDAGTRHDNEIVSRHDLSLMLRAHRQNLTVEPKE